MNPELRDVFVPVRPPAETPSGTGRGDGWPRPVFTPGAGRRNRALADRVREALRRGAGGPGSEGAAHDVAGVFAVPRTARAVVDRLAREARERGCSAVAAPGRRCGMAVTPVAVAAGLPLFPVGDPGEAAGREPDAGAAQPAGAGSGSIDARLGADDLVLLVDDVADTGTRLAEAVERVEETGARVAAVAVVVEVDGGKARGRLEGRDLLSVIRL